MIKFKKYICPILTAAILSSCSSDDKTIDFVLDNFTSGAALRTRSIDNKLVYNNLTTSFDDGSDYTVTFESQDKQEGLLLEKVEIFAGFVDNTKKDENGDSLINDEDNLSIDEKLFQTITIDDFYDGPRGLPEAVFSVTAAELVTFTGIDESKIEGRDDFSFSFTLTLTDGRVFTADDANGNVSGGSYFSSPYEYRSKIDCSITESLADTYTYEITELISAPGGRSNCPAAPLTGEITWSETSKSGVYDTSDISFGHFAPCYVDKFSSITPSKIAIDWECIDLVAEGSLNTVEAGTGKKEEITYIYNITSISGSDMTIDFSNSVGDRGTVILTRPDNKDWPVIFQR